MYYLQVYYVLELFCNIKFLDNLYPTENPLAKTSMFFVKPYLLLNCKNVFDRRRDSNFDIKGAVSQIKCEIMPSVYVIFFG